MINRLTGIFFSCLLLVLASVVSVGNDAAAAELNSELSIMEDVTIVINATPVQFKAPVLNQDGSLLLPMREFYETIGAKVFWNATAQTATAHRYDKRIDLTIHSRLGLVNGDYVWMDVPAMIYQERTYVPLRFVSENLDGVVTWSHEEQKVEIEMDEPIRYETPPSHRFKGKFLERTFGATFPAIPVPDAQLTGNRNLLVSDNPETLTPGIVPSMNVTLSEHKVQAESSENEHRIFAWHLNRLGDSATVGITIQNHSERHALNVTSSKGVAEIGGTRQIIYDIGLPLADKFLNDQLKTSHSEGARIRPGETVTIQAYRFHDGQLIGLLHDLDITSSGGASDYTVRVVLTRDGSNLNHIHSHPLALDSNRHHPRGAWPQSAIVAELPTYTVDEPMVGYSISNGSTDYLQTGQNSLTTANGARGNPGHYGMTYEVKIPIENPTGEEKSVKLKLSGRGGPYSGAVKMGEEVHLVPIHLAGGEYVELPEYTLTSASETLSLEIMHAGGSYLPLAIYIETSS